MTRLMPVSVYAALTDPQAPTPPLADFRLAWKGNPNLVWEIDTGHLANLLEEACEAIDREAS